MERQLNQEKIRKFEAYLLSEERSDGIASLRHLYPAVP